MTSVVGFGDAVEAGVDIFGLEETLGWELIFIYAVLVSEVDTVCIVVEAVVLGVTIFQNVEMDDIV